jgi:hypothetical protein
MTNQNTSLTSPRKREPWNKGKFTGAKPPLRPKHVWGSEASFRRTDERAILRCSTLRSTASCAPAMWLR